MFFLESDIRYEIMYCGFCLEQLDRGVKMFQLYRNKFFYWTFQHSLGITI